MIDFTKCPTKNKSYNGANGKKIAVEYDGSLYMLKFPTVGKINTDMHYTNGCISEYLGCHIFNIIGIKAQETLLGTYAVNGEKKLVVACKDFSSFGIVPQDFASLKNRIIDSERNGYGVDLSDILNTIKEQNVISREVLTAYFWDIFVVDALIGNWDRHNGNWGFLYHQADDTVEISPIYDCGSSLYPQADENMMRAVLKDENELKVRIYERPTSALEVNGKRINYYNFLTSTENEDCCRAVVRIEHAIDLEKIHVMIEETPSLTDLQVEFYKKMITSRKTMILDVAYKRIKRIKPELFTEQDKGNVFFGDVSEGYEESDIDTR